MEMCFLYGTFPGKDSNISFIITHYSVLTSSLISGFHWKQIIPEWDRSTTWKSLEQSFVIWKLFPRHIYQKCWILSFLHDWKGKLWLLSVTLLHTFASDAPCTSCDVKYLRETCVYHSVYHWTWNELPVQTRVQNIKHPCTTIKSVVLGSLWEVLWNVPNTFFNKKYKTKTFKRLWGYKRGWNDETGAL